jgi:hypothetical protein
MSRMRPALPAVILITSLVGANAWAQDAAAPVPPPAAAPAAKPAQPPDSSEGARAARKGPPKRRSVQQIISRMPEPSRPVTDAYRPTLQPPAPGAMAAPPSAAPVQVNRCDAGGCTDINGARYNGGVGNAVIDAQGRLCTRSGLTLQCF